MFCHVHKGKKRVKVKLQAFFPIPRKGAGAQGSNVWKQQLSALGGKGRKRKSNFFAQTIWTALHYEPLETCGRSKAGDEQDLASAALSQPTPPQPCPLEKLRGQPSSRLSKLGRLGAAWQGNFDRQPGDPAPRTGLGCQEDAAPLWQEPACPPPSVAAGQGMPAPGTVVAGERSPLARCTRGAPRVGRRPATGERPVGEGKPICLYLSPRSGAAEPVATGGGQRAQSALAFHTASRASAPRSRQSFIHTAQPGGGGAEREPGSCDRRLGVLALPRRSLRMRATEGPLQAPRPSLGGKAPPRSSGWEELRHAQPQ